MKTGRLAIVGLSVMTLGIGGIVIPQSASADTANGFRPGSTVQVDHKYYDRTQDIGRHHKHGKHFDRQWSHRGYKKHSFRDHDHYRPWKHRKHRHGHWYSPYYRRYWSDYDDDYARFGLIPHYYD